ncbi:hypothetical protein CC78DRAFT_547194 [Lojkania enalia]|uniref:Ubiquitin 3 binding protein But2 C-terminal domain-containing protein n=1 Tax=Lojkania enalia TaxID=147567 RepID=A0A9P4K3Y8_9PLEO|nr:hypothetical protein CC78DRAFT_547194 [Didymosphaeria enalia]
MLLFALPLLSFLVNASPLDRRACAVEIPTYIGWIDSSQPHFNSNPLANNTQTVVIKEPGRMLDTLVEFTIPPGSWGCQLELFFQKGYWPLADWYGGPTRVNIWNVDQPIPWGPYNYSVTWDNAPKPVNLFGTSTELPLPPTGGYTEDVKKIINSAACKEKMTYRVKVPEEVAKGGVQFWQLSGPVNPFGGWRMLHNC